MPPVSNVIPYGSGSVRYYTILSFGVRLLALHPIRLARMRSHRLSLAGFSRLTLLVICLAPSVPTQLIIDKPRLHTTDLKSSANKVARRSSGLAVAE